MHAENLKILLFSFLLVRFCLYFLAAGRGKYIRLYDLYDMAVMVMVPISPQMVSIIAYLVSTLMSLYWITVLTTRT